MLSHDRVTNRVTNTEHPKGRSVAGRHEQGKRKEQLHDCSFLYRILMLFF